MVKHKASEETKTDYVYSTDNFKKIWYGDVPLIALPYKKTYQEMLRAGYFAYFIPNERKELVGQVLYSNQRVDMEPATHLHSARTERGYPYSGYSIWIDNGTQGYCYNYSDFKKNAATTFALLEDAYKEWKGWHEIRGGNVDLVRGEAVLLR